MYRPAAIDQLKTVSAQAGADFFESTPDQKPLDIARMALDHAEPRDCVLVCGSLYLIGEAEKILRGRPKATD